jgi:hypothetical protein
MRGPHDCERHFEGSLRNKPQIDELHRSTPLLKGPDMPCLPRRARSLLCKMRVAKFGGCGRAASSSLTLRLRRPTAFSSLALKLN